MSTLSLTFDSSPGSVTLPITGTSLAVEINWGTDQINFNSYQLL